ncbi:hypothetical protein niasHT_030238 [Heterodera trifolii]|uniref:Uncharacterized protein n=1 Tax=Heterodera trifolii TaxID=157864 RepID=A0ABD2K351_9BILA
MFRKIGTFVFCQFSVAAFCIAFGPAKFAAAEPNGNLLTTNPAWTGVVQLQPPAPPPPSQSSQQRHISVEEDNSNELEQSQQQKHRKKQRRTQQRPSSVGDVRAAVCPFGWLNFRDEQCFYGLSQVRLPFFFGVQAPASVLCTALMSFVLSLPIFDLRHFWIGIFFGSSYFEDGTKVDQRLFEQISPMVPWAPPQTLKGFVCRAVPQFHYGNDKDSK